MVLPPNPSAADVAHARDIRKAHPLYADVSLRLLTEILNSRLFTTVQTTRSGCQYEDCTALTALHRLP